MALEKVKLLKDMCRYDSTTGLVLVGVLWLKIILLAILALSVQNSRLDLKVRAVGMEELRCRWACRAGMEKAVGILNEDPRECDDLTELWSDN